MRTVERQHYKVEYNDKTGEITGLYDRINPVANWKAESEEKNWVPFLFMVPNGRRMRFLLERWRKRKRDSAVFRRRECRRCNIDLKKIVST